MDTTVLMEIGKWVAGIGIGAWTAYKAARGGAHKGATTGAAVSTDSVNQVVNEVVHEIKGPNGGNNLRSIVERIEEKTDDQTRSLLSLHRQQEHRDDRVFKLERRVVKVEDQNRRVLHLVETKLGDAKEVIIKKEES